MEHQTTTETHDVSAHAQDCVIRAAMHVGQAVALLRASGMGDAISLAHHLQAQVAEVEKLA